MRHDPILLESARQGDLVAVERLLAQCRPELRRIAQSQCASSVDPDDAVQESLLLIFRRIGALRTIAAFPAWTFSIVRRECHRLWRAMHGETHLPEDDDHPVFTYTDHYELRRDLAAAIQSLPDKYREAIILRDFEEFSITEIADQLLLTREAVKSRIHRGRQMVQEYLKD
ncbi:MAG: RNA polymerase sigma factor [Rhodanobacter sp.]|uniref:RNA polymerase sigma factor n=1 Tax=Rhodanobacter sp. FW021-MT20 TaxID=1162282 RepID=UPI000260DF57|nr:RNA polymerase sigma factor [Rhodanobacter sp. 115]EIL95507.1 RNA polymerase signa E (sigma 24) [Rhodanobacter sp. 115]TAM26906.1 MAG: RNA polymerase sigma factor [Rhodanobacter sp.]HWU76453.1 RNA polymerase sigma factor [Rhodanobacter sp.]